MSNDDRAEKTDPREDRTAGGQKNENLQNQILKYLKAGKSNLLSLERQITRKKPKTPRKKADEGSTMGNLWSMAVGTLKSIVSFEDRVKKQLEIYKSAFQKWLMRSALMVLSIFMSLVFLILGVFFVAIDYGGVPRGVVFICGGLLGFLVLRLLTPVTK